MSPNLRGAAFMTLSMALFAIEDAIIKGLGTSLPPGQIIAILGAIGAVVLAAMMVARGKPVVTRDAWHRAVVARTIFEAGGTLCFVTALTRIELSTAASILQATPLVVTLAAVLFLKETVGWRRWTAMFVGFAGVLVVLRPGIDSFNPQALWAVGGMLGLAFRDVVTRKIPEHVDGRQISVLAFSFLVPTGFLLGLGSGFAPVSTEAWGGIIVASMLGIGAYLSIVAATRLGEVSFVTPFRYSRLIFIMIIAMLVFGERPDLWTWVGIVMIVGAGLVVFLRERQADATA